MTPAKDLASSVRSRLTALAKEERAAVEEVLVRYARERFLYRLACSPHRDRFVLKGAVLFYVWSDQPHRATRDIDFTGYGSFTAEEVRSVFRDICLTGVEPDGLDFDPQGIQVEEIRDDHEYGGVRVKLRPRLGRARLPLRIDIGVGDVVTPDPVHFRYPTLLSDLGTPELRGYPPEVVVAEKLHTVVRLGLINSRMKDYYDLYVLSQEHEFDGSTLGDAIAATFARRSTDVPVEVPLGLSDGFVADAGKQSQWRYFVARNQLAHDDIGLADVVVALRTFFMPLLEVLARGEVLTERWSPGGPWD